MARSTAFIFDFDGVLVNTMEAHYACYAQALCEAGIPIDKERFFYQAGMTGKEQIEYFAESAGRKVDVDAVYRRKGELFESHLDEVRLIECNAGLMKLLRSVGHPVAIATGSSMKSLQPVMIRYALEADTVVTAADVRRGKPHPDLFLVAADRLGVPAECCLVIEDSDVGIESAQRAGMRAMRFYDLLPERRAR
jgi:HAD superfamily hydrolase (TIGR01509 family)